MFHNYHSSYYQPKIWEVGANPTTCLMQVHQLQVQQMKILPPEKQMPQLVQCKSNNYNCNIPQLQISTCSTTIILLLSTKDLGGRGRSEKKGFHAVHSEQTLTKNLFLVGSFLALPKPSFINQRLG